MNQISTFFNLRSFLFIALHIGITLTGIQYATAAVITSQASGNWNATATWDLNRTPIDGDDVIIADGTTVTANVAVNFATYGSLTVGQGGGGTLNIGGVVFTMLGDLVINGAGTVNCTSGTGGKTFNNIAIYGTWENNANAVVLNCKGNFYNEGTFNQNTGTLNLSGANGGYDYSNLGTHTITTGPMNFNGAASSFSFNTTGTFTPGTGTVTFSGATNCAYAIGSNDPSFYNLTINNATLTLDAVTYLAVLTVTNNLTLTNGTFYSSGTSYFKNVSVANSATAIFNASTLTYVSGTFSIGNAASFVPSTGNVIFNGTANQTVGGVSGINFYDVQISNPVNVTLTNAFTYNVQDNLVIDPGAILSSGTTTLINIGYQWINNGGTFNYSTGTVNFNNPGYYNYITTDGSSPDQTFNHLTVTNIGYYAEAISLNSLTVNGNFTLTSGGFNPPANMTVKGNVLLTAGTFYNPTTNLNVGGNWTNNGGTFDTWNCSCNGIVTFNGSAAQAINGTATTQAFQDIIVDKAGAGAAATLTNATVVTLTINDNFTLTRGTFASAVANSTITINNSGNPSSFAINGGTFSTGATTTVDVNGPSSQTGGTVTSLGQFNYTDVLGAGQTVITGSYANLTLDDNNKTLSPGTISISGIFVPGAGTGHVTSGNTVSFTGNTSQAIPMFNFDGIATGTGYGGLTSTTAKVLPSNLAFNGIFSYAGATTNITLGAMNILVGPAGSIAGVPSATHMIIINGTGRLIKAFNTGSAQSYTYPVGIGASYTPVTLNFNKVTTAGQVGVSIATGVDPNAIAPPTPATNWLKKHWILDKNTTNIIFDYYSAQVAFVAADYNTNLTAGAGGENTMGAMLWDGTNWLSNAAVTSRTARNPTSSYITSLGNLTFATCLALTKTEDPTNQYACVSGQSSTKFTVGLSGTPATYQWYENGLPLSDGGVYSGAQTSQLTLTNINGTYSGRTYYCVVTAVCTGNFTSNTATLGTVNGIPPSVFSISASPATYHPGDNVTITITDTSSNSAGTSYRWVQAFPESGGTFLTTLNDTSKSITINNISAYGTSIKSPGVTWLFVYANNACGQAFGIFYQIAVIPPTTHGNPTTCSGTDGYISFPGLRANTSYSINYSKNNVAQTQLILVANSSGVLTIPNLGPGTYSNIVLIVLGVGSSSPAAPADPVTLIAPCGSLNVFNMTYNNGTSTAGDSVNVCPGTTVGLANADAGVTYNLYESGNGIVATVTTVVTGGFNFNYTTIGGKTYTVVGTQSAATTNMAGGVVVYTAPTAVISSTGGLTGCVIPGVALGTTGSGSGSGTIASYQWADGNGIIATATDSNYIATASGTYTVVITNSNSCSATSSVSTVVTNANPTAVISGTFNGCAIPGALLGSTGSTAGSGTITTYQWQDDNGIITNATDSTYLATAAGNYSVIVTNSNSCSATSSASTITLNANPKAVVNGNLVGCADPGVKLSSFASSAGSGTIGSYQWYNSNGSINGATDSTYVATASGTYSVVVTNSNSCSATSTLSTVTANVAVAPLLTVGETVICPGDSTQICVPDSFTAYKWNNGSTSACTYAKQAGGYWLTVTTADGCTAVSTDRKNITTHPTGAVAIIVQGDTLSSFGGIAYQWYLNGQKIQGATQSTYVVKQTGTYSVEVSNEFGCEATSSEIFVAVGIDELANNPMFDIYPNPALNQIQIAVTSEWIGKTFELYNVQGKMINRGILEQSKSTVDISQLAPGMYFIKLNGYAQKFMKQ